MYKDVLRSISDIGIFPVISFVLFFLFFIVMIAWILMYKKDKIKKLKNLPFESGTIEDSDSTKNENQKS